MTAFVPSRFRTTTLATLALAVLALAGCPMSVSLGDNDAGHDGGGSDVASGDACTGVIHCPNNWVQGADCMCHPMTACAYRDPLPCSDDSACSANGGVCDTAAGHCVCPDAGVTGTCPATEPENGAACSSDGLGCAYGHNTTGCDSDSAECVSGHWQVISTPACPPDAGTDACAGVTPCIAGYHFDMAACTCVADADAGPTACGTLTCGAGQVCVRHLTMGGAIFFADDAGMCPAGREPATCGSMVCCVNSPTYECATPPAGCTGSATTCTCAMSLCHSSETCRAVVSGPQVQCEQDVP